MKKHYLSESEFKDFVLGVADDLCEKELFCSRDSDGLTETIYFKGVEYTSWGGHKETCVIYAFPYVPGAGLIQEDIQEGWDRDVHAVWLDTEQCGLRPYTFV